MSSNTRFSRGLVSRVLGISALIAMLFVAGCTSGSGSTPQFAVTTASGQLATVAINAAYPSTTLTAANGTAPYTWAWSGNTPPGMSLSPAGVLSGTPTSFGTFAFTVTVTDSAAPTPHTATASLTVLINPAITSVALNPTTVIGGSPSTATVTLTGTAAAAASVTLASNNAAATVPATVTVAAGATTATFQVTTSAVTSAAVATVTATYGVVSKTATLTVNPPTVASPLALAQSTVTGGAATTGTVTLTGPAATGGDTVTLGSNNASGPGSGVGKRACRTDQRAIQRDHYCRRNVTATITATFNGPPQTATLTVVPAPTITSFVSAAATITAGNSTTLTGVFSNGTGSVNNSVGAVTSATPATVSPAVTTTYTLTVTNAAGTAVTRQVTVTVVATPTITSFTSAAATITAGTSTTLTGVFSNGTGSVDNSIGAVTSGTAVTVSPASTTTYTLTVTNGAGTTVTRQAIVTVVAAPAITSFVSGAATITAGTSTPLTAVFANGTGSVNNSVGAVTTGIAATVSPAATTTYTLTVTNTANTSVTMLVTVTVVAAPTITSFTHAAATITAGTSTTLTGIFAGGTGSVNNGVGAVTSGTAVTVSPAVTTTYTLTVTNSATTPATSTLTTTVTVVPAPAITSFTPGLATIVTGNSTSLTAVFTGGTGSVDHGVGAVTSGTPVTISPTSTITYTLTVSNAASTPASVTAPATVTVDVPPAITSAGSTSFVIGTPGSFTVISTGNPTATLNAVGALPGTVTFHDNGNGTATISGTATGSTSSYPITITASNGVIPNAVQSFTLNTVLVQAPAITSTSSVTFTAGTSGSFTVTTTGSPVATIAKTGSLPGGINFTDNGNGTATISGSAAGVSSSPITITASNGTLPNATQSFTFNVVAAPVITSFTSAASTITAGTSTTLTGVFSGGTGSVNNSVGVVTSGTAATVSPAVTTIYTLTITNAATTPVSVTATTTVTVVAAPIITSFIGTTTILSGNSTNITPTFSNGTGSISPTVGVVISGTGYSVSPTTTTTYTLTVTNAAGSKLTSTVVITVHAPPQITSANNTTFTVGANGTFTVTTTGSPTPALTFTGSLPSPITFVDNGDGTATISGTPAGASVTPITITASNTVLPNATQSFTLSATVPSCSTNCTISGTVTGPMASGVAIALTGPATANTTTDGSGVYSFAGLAGGTYVVTPSLAGYTFSPSAPSVPTTGSTTTQDFTESSAVTSFSISGTISYAGAKTGNTIIRVFPSGCTNGCSSLAGTSFTTKPSVSGTAYIIRGLPAAGGGGGANGSYVIYAEIDTVGTGLLNESNPQGHSGTVNITTANVTGVNFSVVDRVPSAPQTPTKLSIAPGNGGAIVQYNDPEDSNSEEIATSYKLYYGTDVNATNGTGSPKTFTAQGHGTDIFVLHGLPNGLTYFKMTAVNTAGESAATTPVSVTLAAGSGANTVSGTVTFPGTATGHTLYVGAYGNNGIFFTAITSPVSPQAYSIAGVPSGTYQNFAILDMNDDGEVNPPDISDVTNHSNPPTITVSGSTTGNITLTSSPALIGVPTSVNGSSGQPNSYGLSVQVDYGTKLPISMTLISGKNVAVPYDMNADSHSANYNPIYLSSVSPTVGDAYQFLVTFSDGGTQVVTSTVTAVLTSFAQNLAMQTTSPGTPTIPLLTWTAPAVLPTALPYTYSVTLYNGSGTTQEFWNYYGSGSGNGIPSTQTSVLFNTDGSANPSSTLTVGGTYNWVVFVQDNNNNQGSYTTTYVVP